jgi:hypothetical protein
MSLWKVRKILMDFRVTYLSHTSMWCEKGQWYCATSKDSLEIGNGDVKYSESAVLSCEHTMMMSSSVFLPASH